MDAINVEPQASRIGPAERKGESFLRTAVPRRLRRPHTLLRTSVSAK